MKLAQVNAESRQFCSNCDQGVYTCDECDEYIDEDDEIYCDERKAKNKHYCFDCGKYK